MDIADLPRITHFEYCNSYASIKDALNKINSGNKELLLEERVIHCSICSVRAFLPVEKNIGSNGKDNIFRDTESLTRYLFKLINNQSIRYGGSGRKEVFDIGFVYCSNGLGIVVAARKIN